MTRVPPVRRFDKDFEALRRLTPRDRFLLTLLAEHYLLSTRQIARALFDSLRSAQQRLTILHRLDVLDRYAPGAANGGMETPYLYGLGRIGLQQHPTVYNDLDRAGLKPPRSSRERFLRLTRSPAREHLLGVNQFFVDLYHHARTQPGAALLRWWSEQHATQVYNSRLTTAQPRTTGGVHPDGHGVWTAHGRTVSFFVEHDRGTEPLSRVVTKFKGYEQLANQGHRPAVLLWVPHRIREAGLLELMDGLTFPMPVATAVHSDDPAAPIWALSTNPDHRLALHELPADPGDADWVEDQDDDHEPLDVDEFGGPDPDDNPPR